MNTQTIMEFIKQGGQLNDIDPGTPHQRAAMYDAAFDRHCRRVARLETGNQRWKQLTPDERTKQQEREGDKLGHIITKTERLHMEIGMMIGIRLYSQLAELGQDFPLLQPPPPLNAQEWAKETEEWLKQRYDEGPDQGDDPDE